MNKLIFQEVDKLFKVIFSKESIAYMDYLEKNVVPSFIELDWFISSRFLEITELEHLYWTKEKPRVNAQIVKAFETYQHFCKKILYKGFPHRRSVLREIFFCYKNKKYSAVITLAYSSAEGIIFEVFNQGFWGGYNKNTKKTNFDTLQERQLSGVLNLFKKRFKHRGEINRRMDKNSEAGHDSNNRHLVLHGQSFNYGTKRNAVKAILLLDFISELVYWETHLKDK